MSENKISVLMGIYNCENTLSEAIESIINQTYPNWELVLCDDKSSDDTYKIALKYQELYPDKIILLQNNQNLKLAATLNYCARYATGKYIARMDGDDISKNERFEKQVKFLEMHPNYDLVGTYMKAFDKNGDRNIIPIKSEPITTDLPKFNPFHHATIVMKKSVFDSLGGYHVTPLTSRAEDVDLWFRFFTAGYKGYNIPEPLYMVREDENAFSRRTFRHSMEASRILINGIKMLGLSRKYYIFAMKPMVSLITPASLKRIFRSSLDKRNRRV